jgi:hypothetical protein
LIDVSKGTFDDVGILVMLLPMFARWFSFTLYAYMHHHKYAVLEKTRTIATFAQRSASVKISGRRCSNNLQVLVVEPLMIGGTFFAIRPIAQSMFCPCLNVKKEMK